MDETRNKTHLKACMGLLLVFRKKLQSQLVTQLPWWFFLPDAPEIRKECQIRGVSFEAFRQ
jgi:hypothetical protein